MGTTLTSLTHVLALARCTFLSGMKTLLRSFRPEAPSAGLLSLSPRSLCGHVAEITPRGCEDPRGARGNILRSRGIAHNAAVYAVPRPAPTTRYRPLSRGGPRTDSLTQKPFGLLDYRAPFFAKILPRDYDRDESRRSRRPGDCGQATD